MGFLTHARVIIAALEGDMVSVSITNQGVGISELDQVKLFRKFSHVGDPYTSPQTGNGLGLYICKQLVEALGGTIAMQSAFGEGTTFTYTLPQASQ